MWVPVRTMSSRSVSAGVQGQVRAVVPGGGEIHACLRQPGLELAPVLRGRDDDRHAPAVQRSQQVAGHPFGQFPVVTVELNDVTTDVQVFSPNHHYLHLVKHVLSSSTHTCPANGVTCM